MDFVLFEQKMLVGLSAFVLLLWEARVAAVGCACHCGSTVICHDSLWHKQHGTGPVIACSHTQSSHSPEPLQFRFGEHSGTQRPLKTKGFKHVKALVNLGWSSNCVTGTQVCRGPQGSSWRCFRCVSQLRLNLPEVSTIFLPGGSRESWFDTCSGSPHET